jgi:hypothetical protein
MSVVVVSLLLVIVRGRSEGVEEAVSERKGPQRQVAAKACELRRANEIGETVCDFVLYLAADE